MRIDEETVIYEKATMRARVLGSGAMRELQEALAEGRESGDYQKFLRLQSRYGIEIPEGEEAYQFGTGTVGAREGSTEPNKFSCRFREGLTSKIGRVVGWVPTTVNGLRRWIIKFREEHPTMADETRGYSSLDKEGLRGLYLRLRRIA